MSIEGLDAILGVEYSVLDKGFIRVVDYMGDDSSIVQAARVSYGDGTKEVSKDRGLIRYLMSHQHTTPFEMCEIKFHIKMPIFVARQLMRHRTSSINEMSGRYSIMPNERYVPKPEDIRKQSTDNKQGRGEEFGEAVAGCYRGWIEQQGISDNDIYEELTSEGADVSRELARTVLPVSTYTEFYWKLNLHNLLRFLTLRTDAHAQQEIREYAAVLCDIVDAWTPLTFEAWEDYVKNAVSFSHTELGIIRGMIKGYKIAPYLASGLTDRETAEFHKKLRSADE